MRRLVWLLALGLVAALCLGGYPGVPGASGTATLAAQGGAPAQAMSPRAVLDTYCVTCHNTRALTAGLALDELDPTDVRGAEQTWEKVIRRAKVGMMPPQGMPQPAPEVRAALIDNLERALDDLTTIARGDGQKFGLSP